MIRQPYPSAADTIRLAGWSRVAVALGKIATASPGDGSGLDVPVPPAVVRTSRALAHVLSNALGLPVPDGLYPLPDGEIVFEYRLPDGVIARYIVEGEGRAQLMISYPDGRPAQFTDFAVRSDDRFRAAAVERRRDNRQWGGLTEFDLAA